MEKQTYWPHHYMPACPCPSCDLAYRTAFAKEAPAGECVGCGRIMSVRERDEQGVCNDCAAGR